MVQFEGPMEDDEVLKFDAQQQELRNRAGSAI